MTSVIITGSQGFIGSYLCNEFLENGYDLAGIDNYQKYGKVARPHDSHPNFTLIEHDLSKSFPDIEADYIIAGAAMIGGIAYFNSYQYDLLATNERIVANTIDKAIYLHKQNILKRVVMMSSSMVYENTEVYPTPETEVVDCKPPSSTYGFSKLASEFMCKGAYEQYGLPYTIIRPFNCVGIGEEDALGDKPIYSGNVKMMMSHVLPDLIHKALSLNADDPLPILGDGSQVRHYTNGKDIARGIRLALESDNAVNNDFNISTDRKTSVTELAYIVWNKIHKKNPVLQKCTAYNYDVQLRSPDVTKAQRLLNFSAHTPLEDSIDEVIEYMLAKERI
jgi:nucleoside-diphosphate-sugar epimerase